MENDEHRMAAVADKCSQYDSMDVVLRDYKSRARNEPSRIFHKHKEGPC